MQYIISGRNIDVTEGLKNAVYEKLGKKLERYFTRSDISFFLCCVDSF